MNGKGRYQPRAVSGTSASSCRGSWPLRVGSKEVRYLLNVADTGIVDLSTSNFLDGSARDT
jgi:hypothetical protein